MDVNITTVSLKNCIGKKVFDNSGNVVGTLKDFLLNVQKSYVPFAVLSEGGSFNPAIEEGYVVLPLKALDIVNPDAAQLSLNIATKRLEMAPRFSKAQFINRDGNFFTKIENFYGEKENFTATHAMSENETDYHQSHEGAAENSENETINYNNLGNEADYDKIKGIDKRE